MAILVPFFFYHFRLVLRAHFRLVYSSFSPIASQLSSESKSVHSHFNAHSHSFVSSVSKFRPSSNICFVWCTSFCDVLLLLYQIAKKAEHWEELRLPANKKEASAVHTHLLAHNCLSVYVCICVYLCVDVQLAAKCLLEVVFRMCVLVCLVQKVGFSFVLKMSKIKQSTSTHSRLWWRELEKGTLN